METIKVNRELITIWSLTTVTVVTVLLTRNAILMMPLFVYLMYKSVRGLITYRRNIIYAVPFSFMLMLSFFAIYTIVFRSLG